MDNLKDKPYSDLKEIVLLKALAEVIKENYAYLKPQEKILPKESFHEMPEENWSFFSPSGIAKEVPEKSTPFKKKGAYCPYSISEDKLLFLLDHVQENFPPTDKNIPSAYNGQLPSRVKNLAVPRIVDEEYCRGIAARVTELADVVSRENIEKQRAVLAAAPYTLAYRELEKIALSPSDILSTSKRGRVNALLAKGEVLSVSYNARTINEEPLPDAYEIRIVKPTWTVAELFYAITPIGTCWTTSRFSMYDSSESTRQIVEGLLEDTAIGACLQLIGYQQENPKTYTRLYVAETKEQERILFLDTLEGGNVEWDSLQEWRNARRGYEPAAHLAATMTLASAIGVTKIGLGERETEQLGDIIGAREVELFTHNQAYRKIGLQQGHGTSLYLFAIEGQTKRRVLDLKEVEPPSYATLEEQVGAIEAFVAARSKKLAEQSQKREELQLYCRAIAGINAQLYGNSALAERTKMLLTQFPT